MPQIPLNKKLKKLKLGAPVKPLWDGPESDSDNGGVTQGLLQKFLNDREKLRVLAIEGLRLKEDFNHRIHYGQMWHICEQALAATKITWAKGTNAKQKAAAENEIQTAAWQVALAKYCQGLCAQFPLKRQEIIHWHSVCRAQFPHYVEWWKKHPQVIDREPVLQEVPFKVKYKLPSGRVVVLRGKWDAIDVTSK